jgi:hypothetical protein
MVLSIHVVSLGEHADDVRRHSLSPAIWMMMMCVLLLPRVVDIIVREN